VLHVFTKNRHYPHSYCPGALCQNFLILKRVFLRFPDAVIKGATYPLVLLLDWWRSFSLDDMLNHHNTLYT